MTDSLTRGGCDRRGIVLLFAMVFAVGMLAGSIAQQAKTWMATERSAAP